MAFRPDVLDPALREHEELYPVETILQAVRAVERRRPRIHRGRAERALRRAFADLGVPLTTLRWARDPREAWERITDPFRDPSSLMKEWTHLLQTSRRDDASAIIEEVSNVAWRPAEGRALIATFVPMDRQRQVESLLSGAHHLGRELGLAAGLASPPDLWRHFLEAYVAGLWVFWYHDSSALLVPRPALFEQAGLLHRPQGPALSWRGGLRQWWWRGTRLPWHVVDQPRAQSIREILAEPDAEIRRVMIERYTPERFFRKAGLPPVEDCALGTLYRVPPPFGGEMLALVLVRNSTPGPGGVRRHHVLRVPSGLESVRAAIAWTFHMSASEYQPICES